MSDSKIASLVGKVLKGAVAAIVVIISGKKFNDKYFKKGDKKS